MAPALLMFVAVVLAILGISSILSDLFLRDRSRISQRMDEEFHKRQRGFLRKSSLFKNPTQPDLAEEDAEPSIRERFEVMVEQSGINLAPRQLLAIMGGAGCVLGILGGLIQGTLLAGLLAGLAGASAPLLYVNFKHKARLEKLLRQLPDAFDLMARMVRAGQTMSQALQAVGDEFEPPIAAEFSYCYEQQNLGLPPETALRDLARRTGLLEIKILVLALVIQQQTGGNLVQLLENLAGVVRDRLRIRGKVKALTGEGRMQAAVLLVLPPFLFVVMFFLHRSYAQELLNRPNLLIGTLMSMGMGTLWIRQIIHFDF